MLPWRCCSLRDWEAAFVLQLRGVWDPALCRGDGPDPAVLSPGQPPGVLCLQGWPQPWRGVELGCGSWPEAFLEQKSRPVSAPVQPGCDLQPRVQALLAAPLAPLPEAAGPGSCNVVVGCYGNSGL